VRNKRQKFIELAEKRVTRVLDHLRLVGNLANRSNYEYEDRDVRKILAALEGELQRLRLKFNAESPSREDGFTLENKRNS
jgi:hypothetical protein